MIVHSFKNSLINFLEGNVQSASRAFSTAIERINLKIVAVAITVFAVLTYLIYQLHQWQRKAVKAEGEASESKKKIVEMGEELQKPNEDLDLHQEDPIVQTTEDNIEELPQAPQLGIESLTNPESHLETDSESSEIISKQKEEVLEPIIGMIEQQQEREETSEVETKEKEPIREPEKVVEDPLITVLPILDVIQLFDDLKVKTLELPVLPTLPYSESCLSEKYLCQDQNHVVMEGETETHYLHAHHLEFMGRRFIAAQYPKWRFEFLKACKGSSLVVNLGDFNPSMSYKKKNQLGISDSYVMLHQNSSYQIRSNIKKEDCFQMKCDQSQEIIGLNATHSSHFVVLKSTKKRDFDFTLFHLYYNSWQDQDHIPVKDLEKLVDFINIKQNDPTEPVVVHCSYGSGKTAVVILACVMQSLIKNETITKDNLQEELTKLILEGRKQYGPDFLNSAEQLRSLCDWCQWHFELIENHKDFQAYCN